MAAAAMARQTKRFMCAPEQVRWYPPSGGLSLPPLQQLIHHDNDDDDQADDEPIVERRAGNLRQRIPKDAEDERAQHGPYHRPSPARQPRAPDNTRRDDTEFVSHRRLRLAPALDPGVR